MRLRVVLLSCLMMTPSACSSPDGRVTELPDISADFCVNAKPILVSKRDKFTPGTAKQIINHNETGHRLCGWVN